MKQLSLVANVIAEVEAVIDARVDLDLRAMRYSRGELAKKRARLEDERDRANPWPSSDRRNISRHIIDLTNDILDLDHQIEALMRKRSP